jgi:hypothetical protein
MMIDFINVDNEFDWVVKILNSCVNLPQISTTDKLYESYKNRWSEELSDVKILTLNSKYEREKSLKILELQKNC